MTPERLVLDTNIVIDLLKKVPDVYVGAFAREYKDIESFFSLCQRIDTDSATGRLAGLYANRYCKAFQGISLEDYLLAATAKAHRCPLWTRNRKHYPMDDIELLTA